MERRTFLKLLGFGGGSLALTATLPLPKPQKPIQGLLDALKELGAEAGNLVVVREHGTDLYRSLKTQADDTWRVDQATTSILSMRLSRRHIGLPNHIHLVTAPKGQFRILDYMSHLMVNVYPDGSMVVTKTRTRASRKVLRWA